MANNGISGASVGVVIGVVVRPGKTGRATVAGVEGLIVVGVITAVSGWVVITGPGGVMVFNR